MGLMFEVGVVVKQLFYGDYGYIYVLFMCWLFVWYWLKLGFGVCCDVGFGRKFLKGIVVGLFWYVVVDFGKVGCGVDM